MRCVCEMSVCERSVWEEEATEEAEEKKEKAAGAELKTKTPHNDVGNKALTSAIFQLLSVTCRKHPVRAFPFPLAPQSSSFSFPIYLFPPR